MNQSDIMRQILAILLVAVLMFATMGGLPAILGNEEEPRERIGQYERVTGSGDLTEDHVSETAAGLEIRGPAFTNALRVNKTFLERELGAGWSASKAFTLDRDDVVIDDRNADFAPLDLGADPVFTLGSRDQIEFQDRPMWVSVGQESHGEKITLELKDGDSSGQQVYISRDWLWELGIQWFNVTHEDGTLLPVTDLAGGVLVDVHHFSEVYINPDGLDVKQVVGGVTVANQGETRWFWQDSILEVDVDYNPEQEYEVLIPADWTDLHIRPHTFKVYSSGQLVDNPDTGLQVCCGGGGGSQNYYSVKFSTSGLSVRIEVIGEHLPVYTMQDGELAPHWGEKRWDQENSTLEIDVEQLTSDVQVLVNKNWTDQNIENLALQRHSWTIEELEGDEYYNVGLTSGQTPMTLVFTEFNPSDGLVYTKGSFQTVKLFNLMLVDVTAEDGIVEIYHEFVDDDHHPVSSVMVNVSWLMSHEIDKPRIFAGGSNTTSYAVVDGMMQYLIDFSQVNVSSIQNDGSLVGSLFTDSMESSKCQTYLGSASEIYAEVEDHDGGSNFGYVYVLEDTFCFEWEKDSIPANDLNSSGTVDDVYFTAAFGIWDPSTGSACGGSTVNNEGFSSEKGWATCTWGHTDTLPPGLEHALVVTAHALQGEVVQWTNVVWEDLQDDVTYGDTVQVSMTTGEDCWEHQHEWKACFIEIESISDAPGNYARCDIDTETSPTTYSGQINMWKPSGRSITGPSGCQGEEWTVFITRTGPVEERKIVYCLQIWNDNSERSVYTSPHDNEAWKCPGDNWDAPVISVLPEDQQ